MAGCDSGIHPEQKRRLWAEGSVFLSRWPQHQSDSRGGVHASVELCEWRETFEVRFWARREDAELENAVCMHSMVVGAVLHAQSLPGNNSKSKQQSTAVQAAIAELTTLVKNLAKEKPDLAQGAAGFAFIKPVLNVALDTIATGKQKFRQALETDLHYCSEDTPYDAAAIHH